MSDLVSIIIPAYNCEDYIEKSLKSVLKQTHPNIEVLIADDGSTDRTRALIDAHDDKRIRKFHNKVNVGNLKTVNKLLKEASGEFITFQDGDDWSSAERLSLQLAFLEKFKSVSLCGTQVIYIESGGKSRNGELNPLTHQEILEYTFTRESLPFCAASCMIKREVYQTVGGFREFFDRIGAADFDWLYRIIEKFKVANLSEYMYFYNQHAFSFTHTMSRDLRKIISSELAYFLFRQRVSTGTDSIMTGNYSELDEYSNALLTEFLNDSSLIYNNIAMSSIHKKQLFLAIKYIIIGIYQKPCMRKNYSLLKYCIWKFLIDRKFNQQLIRQI